MKLKDIKPQGYYLWEKLWDLMYHRVPVAKVVAEAMIKAIILKGTGKKVGELYHITNKEYYELPRDDEYQLEETRVFIYYHDCYYWIVTVYDEVSFGTCDVDEEGGDDSGN